jgi:hypothetical protein
MCQEEHMTRIARYILIFSITLIVIMPFTIYNTFAASLKVLEKRDTDVHLQIGGEQRGLIKTIQYDGVTSKTNLQSDEVDPWLVSMDSEAKLKEFLTKHGYQLPKIDFADNYVYLVWGIGNPPYLNPQISQYKITIVRFDDGKLSNAGTSSVLVGGKEHEETYSFLILVISKSNIN